MKNVFVFGGSGFIGTNLIDLLLKKKSYLLMQLKKKKKIMSFIQ